MSYKFDNFKTKHQLLHVSLSLTTILICLSYIQHDQVLLNVGKFWESLIIPFVLIGEICKLLLVKYFIRNDKDIIIQKQNKKKTSFISINDILKSFIIQTICTMLYGFICILLGAPVLQSYEQTFVLALLLTILTVSPTIFLLGTNATFQVVFCEKSDFLRSSEETALELYKYNAAGAIFGAWCGSIVTPLDWDKEWQTYPIPNVVGSLLGCGIANLYFCTKVLLNTGKAFIYKKDS